MTYQISEGIILRATPFRDSDTVFTLFTPSGELSLFKKGGRSLISPLSHVEVNYFAGKGSLYTCRSLAVLNHHIALRKNLPTLETACEMLKAVRSVIVPEQDYNTTFRTLLKCLQWLPQASAPQTLISWFYLFLLHQEGLSAPPGKFSDFHPDPDRQREIKEMFHKLTL